MIQCEHIFCGRDFAADQERPASDRISLTVVDGGYAKAQAVAEEFAAQQRITWEGGFFNWARREGLELAYLDAFDVMKPQPDILVQAISSGMGIIAAHKGAREYLSLGRVTGIPRFLTVQQNTCAPIAPAWHEGSAIKSVTQDEMLRDLDGVDVCYASAASVAAERNERRERRIRPGKVVLLNLTGGGRTQPPGGRDLGPARRTSSTGASQLIGPPQGRL